MEPSTYFFLIFVSTVVVTRIISIPKRIHGPTIHGFRVHHYMYGLALIVVALFFSKLMLYAMGLALFVDELPLILTWKWRWKDYYSKKEIINDLVLIVLVYVFSDYIVSLI